VRLHAGVALEVGDVALGVSHRHTAILKSVEAGDAAIGPRNALDPVAIVRQMRGPAGPISEVRDAAIAVVFKVHSPVAWIEDLDQPVACIVRVVRDVPVAILLVFHSRVIGQIGIAAGRPIHDLVARSY